MSYIRSEVSSYTVIKSSDDSRYIAKVYHTDEHYPELIRVVQRAIDEYYRVANSTI